MFLQLLSESFDCWLVFGPRDALEENTTVTPCFEPLANRDVRQARKAVLTQVLILCCQLPKAVKGTKAMIEEILHSSAI